MLPPHRAWVIEAICRIDNINQNDTSDNAQRNTDCHLSQFDSSDATLHKSTDASKFEVHPNIQLFHWVNKNELV